MTTASPAADGACDDAVDLVDGTQVFLVPPNRAKVKTEPYGYANQGDDATPSPAARDAAAIQRGSRPRVEVDRL
jgi:hypothetical protein